MLLFAFTVFASAALMFFVEPMVARMVLPRAGGSPMVWNTCIVFFQTMLLAGYWYARLLTAKADRRRLWIHGAVLLAPLAFLPLSLRSGAPVPGSNPSVWLLVALSGAVGVPFFVLATTTSLFQRWFADSGARNPYVLYACSNLGSMLALVAYPVVVEPRLTLLQQARCWSVGYAIFVALALGAMLAVLRRPAPSEASQAPAYARASWAQRGRWTLLAFVPSSLMLGVTTYLATDVASVPLLWVVPLALYLLTFVGAFSAWGDALRRYAARALPLAVTPLVLLLVTRVSAPLPVTFAMHLLVFTVLALSCHGELVADRPRAEGLTDFYLWIAVGGVAGGLFNSLVAPLVFTSIAEYPIVLTLACALFRPRDDVRQPLRVSTIDVVIAALVCAFSIGCLWWVSKATTLSIPLIASMSVAALATFAQSGKPLRFAMCVGAMLVAGRVAQAASVQSLYRERTYFGVYHVQTDKTGTYHQLLHGTTIHGQQAIDPARRSEPLTYYTRSGPFGVAFAALPHVTETSRVAVVGLGAGTLATYARGEQKWTFYEIDSAVARVASDTAYFTYLADCGARCTIVIGDARQSLARAEGTLYDLLVLDAFSSDAIPLHLLTREALRLYLARIDVGGVLAFHISNNHLTLGPALARLAESEHLATRRWFDDELRNGKAPSEWMFMSRSERDLGPIASDPRWSVVQPLPSTPLWTDDFANIWSVMKWHSP